MRARAAFLVCIVWLFGACTVGGSEPRTSPSRSEPEQAPLRLADGSAPVPVPEAVAGAVSGTVIGARVVDASSVEPPSCSRAFTDIEGKQPFLAWVSPDGLSVTYRVSHPRQLLACDSLWLQGRWKRCCLTLAPWPDDATLTAAGGGLGLSIRGDRKAGFLWITSPERTAWVLVERDAAWVAYPVEGGLPVRISSASGIRYASTLSVRVVFLDDQGRQLGSEQVEGFVAG